MDTALLLLIPTCDALGDFDPPGQAGGDETRRFYAPFLRGLRRDREGQVVNHRLQPGDVFGRDPLCSIATQNGSVSRVHARFSQGSRGWQVEDLGSTNGTTVAGRRIPRHQPCPLTSPLALRAGGQRLAFVDASWLEELRQPVSSGCVFRIDQLRLELDVLGPGDFRRRHASPYMLVSRLPALDADLSEALALAGDEPLELSWEELEFSLRRGEPDGPWHALPGACQTTVAGEELTSPVALADWTILGFGQPGRAVYLGPTALLEWLQEGQ